jgi:hypothetical protein
MVDASLIEVAGVLIGVAAITAGSRRIQPTGDIEGLITKLEYSLKVEA